MIKRKINQIINNNHKQKTLQIIGMYINDLNQKSNHNKNKK